MVAQLSNVATVEEDLRHHLFGSPLIPFSKMLRDGLADLQAGSCFYCGQRLVGATEVDHFIPRVRCGIDAIENLVLADRPCNGDKSDLLAAPSRWSPRGHVRNVDSSGTLSMIAEISSVDSDLDGDLGGCSVDLRPPFRREELPLWQGRKQVPDTEPRTGSRGDDIRFVTGNGSQVSGPVGNQCQIAVASPSMNRWSSDQRVRSFPSSITIESSRVTSDPSSHPFVWCERCGEHLRMVSH